VNFHELNCAAKEFPQSLQKREIQKYFAKNGFDCAVKAQWKEKGKRSTAI